MSTTHTDSRTIPGDATLVWMASERAAPLFRTLDRARAFDPLLILLAALPAILSTFGETVTPEDAAWGLRALALLGAEVPAEAAASAERYVPAEAVRPAGLWLSAGLMRVVDPTWPISGSLPSLLGGFVLLGLFAPLAARLGGRRLAVWAVLIAAFHPTIVALFRFPAPVTAGLAFGAAALWGYLAADGRSKLGPLAAVAFGVAGGLVLVGPIAATVPLVIAVDQAFGLLVVDRRKRSLSSGVVIGRLIAALVGVVIAVALDRVLPGTVAALPSLADEAVPPARPPAGEPVNVTIGPLWGLAILGVVRLVRVLRSRIALRDPQRAPRLAAVWLAVAGGAVLWTGGRGTVGFDPAARYAAALTVLPLVLVVAYAIEEGARRAVAGLWVGVAIMVPLGVRLLTALSGAEPDDPARWALAAAAVAAAVWLALRGLDAIVAPRGFHRVLLMAGLLAVIGLAAAGGVAEAVRRDDAAGSFRRFTAQLEPLEPAGATVLLTDELPPPRLAFALQAAFPRAPLEIARTWDEASASLVRRFGDRRPKAVVAAWGGREGGGAAVAPDLRPVGEPLLFSGRELLLYVRPEPSDDDPDAAENGA